MTFRTILIRPYQFGPFPIHRNVGRTGWAEQSCFRPTSQSERLWAEPAEPNSPMFGPLTGRKLYFCPAFEQYYAAKIEGRAWVEQL
jgi:hypothetical protein